MALGLLGTGVGLLLMSGVQAGSGWTELLPGFLLAGVGVGLLNPVIADVALSVVSKERSGMAAGINDTFRQVGVAVGVAAWGAIFLAQASDKVASVASGTQAATGGHPRQLVEALTSGHLAQAVSGVPHGAREAVVEATRQGFLTGFNAILVIGGLVAITGAALALWLVREREIERDQPEPAVGRNDTLELSPA